MVNWLFGECFLGVSRIFQAFNEVTRVEDLRVCQFLDGVSKKFPRGSHRRF